MKYSHVQSSPIHFLLYAVCLYMFFVVWLSRFQPVQATVVLVLAILFFLFSLCFRTLTVRDEGQYLAIRYGPINLFGTRIEYDKMTGVEKGKSSIIDGWGIHFIPLRGWTFNLWGFDCAVIHLGNKVIRVGTDDVDNLVSFLQSKTRG